MQKWAITRFISAIIIGAPGAWFLAEDEREMVKLYQTLSHQDLVAKLMEDNITSFWAWWGLLILIGICFFMLLEFVARLVERLPPFRSNQASG